MQGPLQVDTQSWRMTIVAMGNARVSMKVAAEASLRAAGAVLLDRVQQHSSRRDHTLKDLARLGHPYAKRHPRILASRLGADFVKRPYLIHTRSGAFLNALVGRYNPSPMSYDVEARPTVPWVRYVIQGTRKMHPRDVIWETALEKDTKVEMIRAVVDVLGKGLRTQAAIRFSKV